MLEIADALFDLAHVGAQAIDLLVEPPEAVKREVLRVGQGRIFLDRLDVSIGWDQPPGSEQNL